MDDLMDKTRYGKAAFRKFGAVPENFHIYSAAWIDTPEKWGAMRVTGAQFSGRKRVPNTLMTTIVTREEMAAEVSALDGLEATGKRRRAAGGAP